MPDLDEAVRFFVDVLGAELLYREETIRSDDEWMAEALNVQPQATADIAMLRMGPVTNIELFQYSAPDQIRRMPRNSDYSGPHPKIDCNSSARQATSAIPAIPGQR